ncbi:MAG: hypothetical protein Q8911_00505 [Bacillota bacterium]|nr:hypothetical protein [Bacillota bacterium]
MGTTNLDTLSLGTGLQVGAGNVTILNIDKYTPALTPVSVAANTTAEQTFTVTGLQATDFVMVNKPTAQAGLGIVGVRASGANTLAITYVNATAAPIVPTAETYLVFTFSS